MKYDLFTKYLDIEELKLKDSASTIIIEQHKVRVNDTGDRNVYSIDLCA